jgi:hypothetical protein
MVVDRCTTCSDTELDFSVEVRRQSDAACLRPLGRPKRLGRRRVKDGVAVLNGADPSHLSGVQAMAAITGYMWESKAVAWEWAECDGGADAAATLGVEAVAAAPEKRKRRKEQPEVTAVAPDAEGAAAATIVVQPASRKLLRLRR